MRGNAAKPSRQTHFSSNSLADPRHRIYGAPVLVQTRPLVERVSGAQSRLPICVYKSIQEPTMPRK